MSSSRPFLHLLSFLIFGHVLTQDGVAVQEPLKLPTATVASLDGTWLLATDPQNVGRGERWFDAPRPEAKLVKVPWIIQDAFPAYHGAAWYWLDFIPAANSNKNGRSLLRFTNVDFSGEIWLNGTFIGKHEGAEAPFSFDVTDHLKVGQPNRLSVRVMNPDNSPTDGLALHQTPRGARVVPYRSGASYNAGGITGSVDLLTLPAVRVDDVHVIPDYKTGEIRIETLVFNALSTTAPVKLTMSTASAASGETIQTSLLDQNLPPGESVIKSTMVIPQPRLWDIIDPFLYRATVHLENSDDQSSFEKSVRFGFRDFRLENGYFRLNGRRIFLRSTHTTGGFPIGQTRPTERDLARRDLINLKTMGFNMIRFIWGGSEQYLLDFCDEIGLMVYQESLASQPMEDSLRLGELFDASVAGIIQRDRNHPSIVMWGLLNEAQIPQFDMAFRHATKMLPLVNSLDSSRVVILNSGRFDGLTVEKLGAKAQISTWCQPEQDFPSVSSTVSAVASFASPTTPAIRDFNPANPNAVVPAPAPVTTNQPAQILLHSGPKGEFSSIRWTASESGTGSINAQFSIQPNASGSVSAQVLQNGKPIYRKTLKSGYPIAAYAGTLSLAKDDTIDFVIGPGGKLPAPEVQVGLAASIMLNGTTYDAIRDYSSTQNPVAAWSYGHFATAPSDPQAKFTLYSSQGNSGAIGSIANPGQTEWQDTIKDDHTYPRVPHTAGIIQLLRTKSGTAPVFLSEYGIGSAVDLWRVVRHFERLGKLASEDGQYYQERLNKYLADWEQWKLNELYARPEDFFTESIRKMAGQRTLGMNAIRANPNIIGYNLTSGAGDPVNCGEGLTTTFRELKPGAIDAVNEGFAPLRWCLFVEPANIYRGNKVLIEAVIANEDTLPPGDYPATIQVVGPNNERIFERKVTAHVPSSQDGHEAPLAFQVFKEEIPIDGPAGRYRLLATLEQGGAPTGGEVSFFVDDSAQMPAVNTEVVLWGDDTILAEWLPRHGIKVRPFVAGQSRSREVILVGARPPSDPTAFAALAQRIMTGSTAIFLAPEVFQKGNDPVGWLPLAKKGTFAEIKSWLYLKDEWAKRHPIFEGLPSGGLMDPIFYREIIPDTAWIGQDPPLEAVAGAIKASEDYTSGLMVSVYSLGSGRFILSNLLIRENLGTQPVAERILRNLIRYAARESLKPPTALPADFETQLQKLGYK